MRVPKSVVAGVVLMAIVICWTIPSDAKRSVWPNQKGEICVYNITTLGTARIAVVKTVGNNYMLQGVTTEADGKTLFDGNAVIDGNVVLMNISGSGYDPLDDEAHGFVGTVELNLDTKTGWVKVISFHCEGQTADCAFSNDGTQYLSIVDCE